MRKILFEVPVKVIGDFTKKLSQLELENSILGHNEDDEIVVEVFYEKSEAKEVDELEEHLEELIENMEEDEEDEEEDDDK